MKRPNNFLFVIILLAVASQINAQVKTDFNNRVLINANGKFNKTFLGERPYVIPARNISDLVDKEVQENLTGEPKPFKIAEALPVDIDVVRLASWTEENGYAYGKFTIHAAGAKSISVNFDKFYLPPGTELYVYSEKGEMITGPITEAENNDDTAWGTWVYKGGILTCDLKCPVQDKAALKLHISNVAYGYKDVYRTEVGGFDQSSPCNINVICPLGNGWEIERNSVALILDANGQALCSGALLNNVCNLNIPYLLTANHCFQTNPQQNVGNWRFTFQAWSPQCNPSVNVNGVTYFGSTLRANSAGSDFCLVEMNQVTPAGSNLTYSGWSRNTAGVLESTIIHHPAGDVMKISRDNNAPFFATFLNAQCWQLGLDQGATNGGSSGAPYFDQNHRIIGQHFGINQNNPDPCLNTNKFGGRFDISWTGDGTDATRLSNWLDPTNTNAMTIDPRGIPFITGQNLVCTSGTFTLNNPPPNATWSVSPSNLVSPSSGTGTIANVTKQSNGNAIITFSYGCGNTSFSFHTGPYSSSDYPITGPSSAPCNAYVYYSIPTLAGVTSINWSWPSGWTYVSGQGTTNLALRIKSSGVVSVGVNNTCGQSGSYATKFTSMSGSCGFSSFTVHPNPASNELNISFVELDIKTNNLEELESFYDIKIYNNYQELIYSTRSNRAQLKIDTNNFPSGPYVLNVVNGEGIIQRKIFIAR